MALSDRQFQRVAGNLRRAQLEEDDFMDEPQATRPLPEFFANIDMDELAETIKYVISVGRESWVGQTYTGIAHNLAAAIQDLESVIDDATLIDLAESEGFSLED